MRHRSHDIRCISGKMHALGLLGPMPRLDNKYTRITHLFSYIHGRPIYGHDDCFLLIARLILILKGYT